MSSLDGFQPYPRPLPRPLPTPTPVPQPVPATAATGAGPGTGFEPLPRILTSAEVRAGLAFDEGKLLSSLAYDGQVGQERGAWRVHQVWEDSLTGFRAILAEPRSGDDPRKVLAFAGTSVGSISGFVEDGITDLLQIGLIPSQYGQAFEVARQMHALYGDDLRLTGHSLGGGLASLSALLEGIPAMGFNSAPLGLGSSLAAFFGGQEGAEDRIVQLDVAGEFVHHTPGWQPGTICTVPGEPGIVPIFTDHFLESFDLHRPIRCDDEPEPAADLGPPPAPPPIPTPPPGPSSAAESDGF